MSKESKPAHVISARNLKCNIWKIESNNGSWYSVTFERHYEGGKAKSFGRDDLLVLAEMNRQAFIWISVAEGAEGLR